MKTFTIILFLLMSVTGYGQTIYGVDIADREAFKLWNTVTKDGHEYHVQTRSDMFDLVAYNDESEQLQFRRQLPGEDDFFTAWVHLEEVLGEASDSKDDMTDFAKDHFNDMSKATLVVLGDLAYKRLWNSDSTTIALIWNQEGLSIYCTYKE